MSPTLPDAQRPLFEKMVRRTVHVTNGKTGGYGAGVVISEHGLVLTAYHVIAGCRRARVKRCRLADDEWRIIMEGRYTADVVFEDRNADIAVLLLRKPPKRLDIATVGGSTKLYVGEAVYRVGMDDHHMASGHVISIAKTTVTDGRRRKIPSFGVSMPSDFGASGGPTFDTALELVGVSLSVTVDKKEPSISYCIPIHAVMRRISRRTAVKPYLPGSR